MRKKYINPKQSRKYAIQCQFNYGWDYIGSCDDERLLYDTLKEAIEDIQETLRDMKAQNMDTESKMFRPVLYNPNNDTKSDL